MTKRHHLLILAFLLSIGVSTTFICAMAIDHSNQVQATAEQGANVDESDITVEPEETATLASVSVGPLVSNASELVAALSDSTIQTITLQSDIISTENIYIARDVEINLNGHSIISETRDVRLLDIARGHVKLTGTGKINANGADSIAVRLYGSIDPTAKNYTTLTVGLDVTLEALGSEGSYGLLVSFTGTGKTAYGVTVNLNGHINGYQGMTINGNIQHSSNSPVINIADGASITSNAVNGMSIYAAGYGVWNIDAATLAGGTGIGAKAGIFTLVGTKIVATGVSATGTPHNGSMDSTGSAIQLEGHTAYAGNVRIIIDGGVYSSTNSSVFYEYSDNQAPSVLKGLNIQGGTFTAATGKPVFADLRAETVSLAGGNYSSDVTSYLSSNQKLEATVVDGQTIWTIKGSAPNKPTVPDSKPDSPVAGNLNPSTAIAAVATTTAAVIAATLITLGFVLRCVFLHFREAKAGGAPSASATSAKSSSRSTAKRSRSARSTRSSSSTRRPKSTKK